MCLLTAEPHPKAAVRPARIGLVISTEEKQRQVTNLSVIKSKFIRMRNVDPTRDNVVHDFCASAHLL